MSKNLCILHGRLTDNPELKMTQSNLAFTGFNLAVNRDIKNKDGKYETDFIPVTMFGKTAENFCKYHQKGSDCLVVGRLQRREYTDKKGEKKYATEVVADSFDFIGSSGRKTEQEAPAPSATSSLPDYIPAPAPIQTQPKMKEASYADMAPEEDLPF